MPKASSTTFTMGTKQLVVHEALDTTTKSVAGSNSVVVDPDHEGRVPPPLAGAEMMTRRAPAFEVCGGRLPRREEPGGLDDHVHVEWSHGRALGSRSASTAIGAAVEHEGTVFDASPRRRRPPVGRVVAEQVGEGLSEVRSLTADHLDVGAEATGPLAERSYRCGRSR